MVFDAILNLLKKGKTQVPPPVPPLDSKSNNVPVPKNPFSKDIPFQSSSSNQMGSKFQGLDDLPDFPDFPGTPVQSTSSQGNQMPKSFSMPQPSFNESNFSPRPSAISDLEKPKMNVSQTKADKINQRLDAYDFPRAGKESFVNSNKVIEENGGHYISIHDYKQILDYVDSMKDNCESFENSIMQLHDIAGNSAALEESFKKAVEEIQRKLVFVDKTIFETPIN